MNNVRAKKSRKNRRANSTKMGFKRKRRQKKVKIVSSTVAKAWDSSKTVKQNFHSLGLAFNPNSAVPLPKRKGAGMQDEERMDIDKPASSVVKEFEEMAAVDTKTERRISPGEAQFLFALIKDHGDNYKAMARDKRNYYQHTVKQLKRKCQSFLSSSQDFSEYLKESS